MALSRPRLQQIPKPVYAFSALTGLAILGTGTMSFRTYGAYRGVVCSSDCTGQRDLRLKKQDRKKPTVSLHAQAADAQQLHTIFTFCRAWSIRVPAYLQTAYSCSAGL